MCLDARLLPHKLVNMNINPNDKLTLVIINYTHITNNFNKSDLTKEIKWYVSEP